MTDREKFEEVLGWFGMVEEKDETVKLEDGNVLIHYYQSLEPNPRFTCEGYDEFDAGAIFTPEGEIVKGYLDSHVCSSSKNSKLFRKILNDSKNKK